MAKKTTGADAHSHTDCRYLQAMIILSRVPTSRKFKISSKTHVFCDQLASLAKIQLFISSALLALLTISHFRFLWSAYFDPTIPISMYINLYIAFGWPMLSALLFTYDQVK